MLHDIHLRERYILGGCVADLWTGISALLQIHGELLGGIGYMGISFGGGIGALALPWERRIARAHLNVPTFGHQPLRLRLPTVGSGAAVQGFARRHLHVAETLAFFPVINVECSTVEDEPFYGEDENSLRACATGFNFSDVYARIDGKPVKGLDNFDV